MSNKNNIFHHLNSDDQFDLAVGDDALYNLSLEQDILSAAVNKNIDLPSFDKFLAEKKDEFSQVALDLNNCERLYNNAANVFQALKKEKVPEYRGKKLGDITENHECKDTYKVKGSDQKDFNYEAASKNFGKYLAEFLAKETSTSNENSAATETTHNNIKSSVEYFSSVQNYIMELSKVEFATNGQLSEEHRKLYKDADFLTIKVLNMKDHLNESPEIDAQRQKNIKCGQNYVFSSNPCPEGIDQKPYPVKDDSKSTGFLSGFFSASSSTPQSEGYCCYKEFIANTVEYAADKICLSGDCHFIPKDIS